MPYNYSRSFLTLHADLVQKLTQIAVTGEVLSYESDDWHSISNRQQLINNLLSSISKNLPEYADIRVKVRCWTAQENGKWQVFVGVAQHKVVGRPPGVNKRPLWMETYVPASSVGSIVYVHPNLINDADELTLFVGKVISQSDACKRCEAKVAELSGAAVEYFNGLFEPYEWKARAEDGTLILERK